MITKPKIERRNKQPYVAIRTQVPIPFGKYLPPLWDEVNRWLKMNGIKKHGPAMIRYLTTDMSNKLDIDVGFAVEKAIIGDDRIVTDVLPAGRYATLLYSGSYKGTGVYKANIAMMEWANENHVVWRITKRNKVEWWNGRVEWYLTDPEKESDTKNYKTELAFLVAD